MIDATYVTQIGDPVFGALQDWFDRPIELALKATSAISLRLQFCGLTNLASTGHDRLTMFSSLV